ncbi:MULTISPECIES: hypothetical protein [Arthrobacter]|uniref:Uncharacterized protein n=2 Tax=Arthrobacter TaxID=1663 RepID=A0ABU9KN35_9MICC|nr:hypothetical protein [Arthrobacter sp. YJM1]MDP5227748.1 hypothetical protein [Arthrobacter sp. YJM1]
MDRFTFVADALAIGAATAAASTGTVQAAPRTKALRSIGSKGICESSP